MMKNLAVLIVFLSCILPTPAYAHMGSMINLSGIIALAGIGVGAVGAALGGILYFALLAAGISWPRMFLACWGLGTAVSALWILILWGADGLQLAARFGMEKTSIKYLVFPAFAFFCYAITAVVFKGRFTQQSGFFWIAGGSAVAVLVFYIVVMKVLHFNP
jgi:hypothetical protein